MHRVNHRILSCHQYHNHCLASFVWEYHCFWCSVSQHQYNYSTCFRCAGNVTSNDSLSSFLPVLYVSHISSFLPVLYVSHLSSFLPFQTSGICHRSCQFHTSLISNRSCQFLYIRHLLPFLPVLYISHLPSFLPFYTSPTCCCKSAHIFQYP